MSIDRTHETQKIILELQRDHAELLKNKKLLESISSQIDAWGLRCNAELRSLNPYTPHLGTFLGWRSNLSSSTESVNDTCLSDYQDFCSVAGVPSNIDHWKRTFSESDSLRKNKRALHNQKHARNRLSATAVFFDTWQKQLDQAISRWEMETLARLREEFIKNLLEKLDLIDALNEQIEGLGLDFGFWFDDSLGKLDKQSMDSMKRWLRYMANDESVRTILDLLGRMRQIENSTIIEEIEKTVYTRTPSVDANSRQEIVGIYLGKDIEHAVPSELSLIGDPDTSILFDLKYIESKLMCFEMQGISWTETETTFTEEIESQEEKNAGPMILCVDTSGSMSGTPEAIAKAVAFFLASKAREKDRPCYIINFSTGIDTFEVSRSGGMAALMRFLQNSFHGGTDVGPALMHAIDQSQTSAYENADTLVISDFVMGSLSQRTLDLISDSRQKGNRYYSLVIGDAFMTERLNTHFDKEWIYNPSYRRIDELIRFGRDVLNGANSDSQA